jgi:hypothetical protein
MGIQKSIPKLNFKIEKLSKLLLDDPTLSDDTYFLFFTCDRDPTAYEPVVDGISIPTNWVYFWLNTSSGEISRNRVPTSGSMVWGKNVEDQNILSILSTLGWNINTNRAYSLRSSPAFGTEYTPSTTNDTQVILSETITLTGEIQAQVNSGSGYVVVGQSPVSGAITFIVPANAAYKIVSVSGLSNSIVSLAELTL